MCEREKKLDFYIVKLLNYFFIFVISPTNQFALVPASLTCTPDPIFLEASSVIPTQIFDVFPSALIKMVPGIVDVCAVDGDFTNLAACVSGENSHTHHHFELVIKGVLPVQIHALCLALFASFVAPFGGFLASGRCIHNCNIYLNDSNDSFSALFTLELQTLISH